eukprot:scaffold20371_cov102-Isochrysis_galbana.AAC.5
MADASSPPPPAPPRPARVSRVPTAKKESADRLPTHGASCSPCRASLHASRRPCGWSCRRRGRPPRRASFHERVRFCHHYHWPPHHHPTGRQYLDCSGTLAARATPATCDTPLKTGTPAPRSLARSRD